MKCCCCQAEALPDRSMCERHLAMVRANNVRRRERLRAAGLCQRCGKAAPHGSLILCLGCVEKERAKKNGGWLAELRKNSALKKAGNRKSSGIRRVPVEEAERNLADYFCRKFHAWVTRRSNEGRPVFVA